MHLLVSRLDEIQKLEGVFHLIVFFFKESLKKTVAIGVPWPATILRQNMALTYAFPNTFSRQPLVTSPASMRTSAYSEPLLFRAFLYHDAWILCFHQGRLSNCFDRQRQSQAKQALASPKVSPSLQVMYN